MTDKLRQAAQALIDRWDSPAWGGSAENLRHTGEYIAALRAALDQPMKQPDGLPMAIAGALFDFAGFLTTREKLIVVGSTADAAPIADLVKEWAGLRELSLDDAAVRSWQEWVNPQQQPAVPQSWAIAQAKETLEWIISLHTGGLIQARATDALAALNAAPEAPAQQTRDEIIGAIRQRLATLHAQLDEVMGACARDEALAAQKEQP